MTSNAKRSKAADVLLVEDNPGDVRLTQEAFKDGRINNELHIVTDGLDALDFLLQQGDYEDAPQPDIVLLDLNLPRMNGQEVLKNVKHDEDLRAIPIIVLTSSQAQEDVLDSYNLHANAYLTKPVDPDKFIDTVRSLEGFWLSVVRLPTDGDE